MNITKDLKSNFVEMCVSIHIGKGGFFFPFEMLEENNDFQDFINSEQYPILKMKMEKLITLINEDANILNKDIEDEIFDTL